MPSPKEEARLRDLPFDVETPSLEDEVFKKSNNEGYVEGVLSSRISQRRTLGLKYALESELWQPLLDGLNSGDEILDVGSGGAFHLEALNDEDRGRLTLLDASASMLIEAKKTYPSVGVIKRNWFKTKLPNACVKRISGFNADTFIRSESGMESFLSEAIRVLAPKGRMILVATHIPPIEWTGMKGVGSHLPPEQKDFFTQHYHKQIVSNFQKFERDVAERHGCDVSLDADFSQRFRLKYKARKLKMKSPFLKLTIEK